MTSCCVIKTFPNDFTAHDDCFLIECVIVSRLFRNRHTGLQEVSGASRENSTLCIVCQVSEFVSLLSFPKKSPRFKEEHKETVSPLIPQESDTRREKGCNVLIFVCSELIRRENFACDDQRVQLDRDRTERSNNSLSAMPSDVGSNCFLNEEGKLSIFFPWAVLFHEIGLNLHGIPVNDDTIRKAAALLVEILIRQS